MGELDTMLEFIQDFWDEHNYSPSFRDIMKGCGYSSTSTVALRLSALRSQGKITYQERIARSVRVT